MNDDLHSGISVLHWEVRILLELATGIHDVIGILRVKCRLYTVSVHSGDSGTGGKHWSGNKETTGQFNTQDFHISSGSFDSEFITTYPSQSGAQQIGQGVDPPAFCFKLGYLSTN